MHKSAIWIAAFLVLCVAFSPALADKEIKKQPKSLDHAVTKGSVAPAAYFEGFEGAFPPVGWSQTITNPGFTWVQDCLLGNAFEGLCQAYLPWQVGVPQNEILSFSYLIDSANNEDHLVFATMGSNFWCTNADLTVWIDGVQVWDFCTNVGASFVWAEYDIDLSAYDGQTVLIEFIYAGDDGADQHLDAVRIDDGIPPPPPPPDNDDCAGVIDLSAVGVATFTVDLCLATNQFVTGSPSCTGFSANGNDVVYKLWLFAGDLFIATEDGSHDMAMYLQTDCFDPNSCVAGSDECCSGAQEMITYTAPADGWYYLIVDGFSSCSVVTIGIDAPIPTEDATWGQIKELYSE